MPTKAQGAQIINRRVKVVAPVENTDRLGDVDHLHPLRRWFGLIHG